MLGPTLFLQCCTAKVWFRADAQHIQGKSTCPRALLHHASSCRRAFSKQDLESSEERLRELGGHESIVQTASRGECPPHAQKPSTPCSPMVLQDACAAPSAAPCAARVAANGACKLTAKRNAASEGLVNEHSTWGLLGHVLARSTVNSPLP